MSIVICIRCGAWTDLDYDSDNIEWIDDTPICWGCLTDKEKEDKLT